MKKIIALLLVVVMALGLIACGQAPESAAPAATEAAPAATEAAPAATEAAPAAITLKVWGPQEDQADENSFLPVACEKFDEAHPEWDIEFVFEVCGEGDAGNNVTKDPTAAGDVYAFASDQRGKLRQANAIARLGGAALDQVMNANYGDARIWLSCLSPTPKALFTVFPSPPTPGSCTTTSPSTPRKTSSPWTL